jgi:hypothetical protein
MGFDRRSPPFGQMSANRKATILYKVGFLRIADPGAGRSSAERALRWFDVRLRERQLSILKWQNPVHEALNQ